jgi:hypothetical protein
MKADTGKRKLMKASAGFPAYNPAQGCQFRAFTNGQTMKILPTAESL